jgi:hypothetical protein
MYFEVVLFNIVLEYCLGQRDVPDSVLIAEFEELLVVVEARLQLRRKTSIKLMEVIH